MRSCLIAGVLLPTILLTNTVRTVAEDDAHEAAKPAAATAGVTLTAAIEVEKPDAAGKTGDSVTQHTVTIAGKSIAYTATAGTLPLTADDGKTKADVFYIAYTVATDAEHPRPITYCFNGGPGSSSVWLHMGMLGPKRVKLADEPTFTPPPHTVVENPFSLLDVTDLVFIDPVSTGYSRPAAGQDKKQFHGVREDLAAVGEFIWRYTTRAGRWGSPKFLCGESYGTLRAAALAGHLQDTYNMELNGIVLVSTVLDFQTLSFGSSNDLPYILFLPTYTATAWYHKALPKELQTRSLSDVVAEARRFALEDYATALLKGDSLPKKQRREIASRMAHFTGLSRKFVERSNLRVSMQRFGKELLRKTDRTVGRFDSRFTGIDADGAADSADYDASAAALFGPFTSALYQHLRNDLKVEKDVPYEILTGNVQPWNYSQFTNRYVDVGPMLGEALAKNPALHVFVANGYYDLATPFAAAEYTFSHVRPAERQKNIRLAYYEAGHMMYVHEPSLARLRDDLVKFYEEAQPATRR